jgi:hypothetical protein
MNRIIKKTSYLKAIHIPSMRSRLSQVFTAELLFTKKDISYKKVGLREYKTYTTTRTYV